MTILEIRTYRLRPGTTTEFDRVVRERCLPLLRRFGVDVVRTGPSEQSEDGVQEYVLIRAFGSLAERDRQEEVFYGSAEWMDGPRLEIVSRIQQYTIVLTVPDGAERGLAVGGRTYA